MNDDRVFDVLKDKQRAIRSGFPSTMGTEWGACLPCLMSYQARCCDSIGGCGAAGYAPGGDDS